MSDVKKFSYVFVSRNCRRLKRGTGCSKAHLRVCSLDRLFIEINTSKPSFSMLPFVEGGLAALFRFVGGSCTPKGRFANGGGLIPSSCMPFHTADV